MEGRRDGSTAPHSCARTRGPREPTAPATDPARSALTLTIQAITDNHKSVSFTENYQPNNIVTGAHTGTDTRHTTQTDSPDR